MTTGVAAPTDTLDEDPAGSCRRGSALLICVGLALFVVGSRLEAALGALLASSEAVAAVQLGLAALAGLWAARAMRAPSRRLLRTGAAGAVALAALWVATRTPGLAGSAPIGLLDALTTLDELLLAAFALAGSSSAAGGRRGARWDGWSAAGSVAISLSFVALAMGCEPATAPASGGAGSAVTPLVCHLY